MAHGDAQRRGGELGEDADSLFDAQVADAIEDSATDIEASQVDVDSTTLVGTGTDVQAVLEELDNSIVAEADIAAGLVTTHAALDLAAAVHGFKGIVKHLADGEAEVVAVDEVKVLTMSAGLATETFTLTVGGEASGVVTLPTGGHANLTAAAVEAALESGTMNLDAGDVAVSGSAGGPFLITYGGSLAATDIGNMTMTDKTGAADGTITDDGSGSSVVGVVATEITVTGIAAGDSLATVQVYATKADIATTVLRDASDFAVGAGVVTVVDNAVDNTNNQYLFEWVDLT